MDNEVIIQIREVEYHFKLKSQKIVELEKLLGKNIFDIFSDMSFTSLRLILSKCCLAPENADPDKIMDDLMTKYSLIELANDVVKDIAVKSGLLKQSQVDEADAESKNA